MMLTIERPEAVEGFALILLGLGPLAQIFENHGRVVLDRGSLVHVLEAMLLNDLESLFLELRS